MRATLLLALLCACESDTFVHSQKDLPNGTLDTTAPDIRVTPALLQFGEIPVEGSGALAQTVRVENLGDAELVIGAIELEDAAAPYTIAAISSLHVPPGLGTEFTVSFDPDAAGAADSRVLLESNDPDQPVAGVDLEGVGVAPRIALTPTDYDFGAVELGCDGTLEVTLSNVGNADLVVTDLTYISASPDELGFDGELALPITLPPGESSTMVVGYTPADDRADTGYLVVSSNDPIEPEAQAWQSGSGDLLGTNLDTYDQPIRTPTDILFVVDNSGSMGQEQANLADNFSTFISTMVLAEADYHIAVITTDNPRFQGDVITADSSDPIGDFIEQCQVGTNGSGDEMGLEMAWQSLQPDGDAGVSGSFLRDEARLSLVIVSDEVDSSSRTGRTWADYVAYYRSLKDESSQVQVHAIAGDYPRGCATADPGVGYYEAVAETDGLYLSICTSDWAQHLEALGESVSVELTTFDLTETPVPATIEVRVDGVTRTSGWVWSEAGNEIVFQDGYVPEGGSTIEIEYALAGDCAG